jgi:hypothetical protein
MTRKLPYAVLTLAMAGGLAVSSAGAASAAHRYNVETGNGECKPTSASATDNANDSDKERSENSEAGQKRAAERSPAISGTGSSRECSE